MTDQEIQAYGREKGYHRETLENWLRLNEADRGALLGLARDLKMGANHFRDFLEWLEEIARRDNVSLSEILNGESLSRISSNPRLSRGDKLKQIKEEVRRLRFPRLSRLEGDIRNRIREMKFSPRIQVSIPPGLEGGALTVQLQVASHEELGNLVGELAGGLEKKAMKEVFELLSGIEEV